MEDNTQRYIDFEAYERASEPHKREKASAWRTAIGLQDVDGLRVSDYLKETALKHIEGDITIDDVRDQLQTYYLSKTTRDQSDQDTEEADKVAVNITKLLNERSFSLKASEYLSIHRHIFEGVFEHAGEIRNYDISKKEWVLQGDTILYGRADDIMEALKFHPFREGNTRTTAVFMIKYLRSMGFNVNNDLFADNSWYFRNALVRANYRNPSKGIDVDKSFLEKFFRNLILNENNELKNRYMLIDPSSNPSSYPSTHQVTETNSFIPEDAYVARLIHVIGTKQLSLKAMMDLLGLKDRVSFKKTSLSPYITQGLVTMLYPDKPNTPRQKYLLTTKGLKAYHTLEKA